MGLSEFLLARIAEDEAVARRAGERDQWRVADREVIAYGSPNAEVARVVAVGEWDSNAVTDEPTLAEWADHIARHNPARVLAECEAKRRIVAWAGDLEYGGQENDLLKLLALPYADHPDYDEDWRP